jgi:predicted nucleic acid-binding protein
MTNEQIDNLLVRMDKETEGIREEAFNMSWYLRGGISYNDALQLSLAERKIISKIIKDHMETTKKSGLPFF